ncbi:Ldh family oxidoreductase [Candidatus Saccharibacteria bacterium]|nr:MAG: Ldh family oxidoreductase [Candidatus Saccharibacteria bacterium]
MKISISTLKEVMTNALRAKEYSDADIPFIIDMFLGGELRGHVSHGLASFSGFIAQDFSGLSAPEVLAETQAVFIIDAKSHSGNIVGKRAADEAITRAKKAIVGTALVKNMDSWLRPGAIAEYIARQGYFAIVMNDGGGSGVAPPGGYDPVVSTNPIAYAIPTEKEPLVVDLATAKRAWGQVRLANKYGTELPEDTYYDTSGQITRDPKLAHSVMPMGDYKGFALALMIEILCGSLVGMENMFVDTKGNGSQFGRKMMERGGIILVIDPRQTSGNINFKQANTTLLERIHATNALFGETIRIPGEKAGELAKQRTDANEIDIPRELWEEIKNL